jgi:hypothetical protein
MSKKYLIDESILEDLCDIAQALNTDDEYVPLWHSLNEVIKTIEEKEVK